MINKSNVFSQCEIPGYTFGGNYEGHSYYISDETATWTEARTLAISIGGHLATISNAGENSFVADVAALANNPQGVWIGLTDEVVEATFNWVTGEPLIYTNWEPGEPNDLGGEDYTEIYTTDPQYGSWNDLSDDWQLEYVVEFDTETCDCNDPPDAGDDNSITVCNDAPPFDLTEELGGNPDPGGIWSPPLASGGNIYDPEIDGTGVFTYTVSDSECPSDAANVSVTVITCSDPPCEIPGYTFGGNYEGHSYYVSDAQVTWHEAKTFATSIGGHLATISNACENAFVAYVAALSNNPEGVWIGLTDEIVEGTFEWVTGEPFIYTNWAPGEPNNGLGQGEQDFGQIYIFSPLYGLWDDYFAWVDYHEYVVEFETETCNCTDPLTAGDDNSIAVCNDSPPFDLTEELGGNPDPGGTWSPPLASGGNIYDPVIDGAGSFIYTVSASGCPSDNACVSVTVIDPIIPLISGVPSSMCEYDSPFSLSIIQDGITGNWSGQGVSNNTFDPSGIMGNVTLTFTPNPGQCAVSTTTSINVTPIVTPLITGVPESVCEISPPFTLATFQNGINGNWSGPGVSNNIFYPEDQNGIITLTFIPLPGQCADAVEYDIEMEPSFIPTVSGVPSEICQTDLPLDLPDEQDGYSGIWSGPGVNNNTFDPNGWNGNLTLIFEPDDGQCAAFASTIIWVEPATTPSISGVPNSLCETEEPIQLSTHQDGIVGNWSGPGVSSNTFNPVGQNGNITLTFIPVNGQCALPTTIVISVSSAIAPIITGVPASLCQSDSVLLLTGLQSGITGIWSGLNVNADSFSTTGLNGNYTLTFSPNSGQCADTTAIQISVLTPPSFTNLIAACDSMMESYTVSFEITGDDPTSYMVNGMPVNGTIFTSSPILADSTNYTFTLDDANGCGPVDIQGSINCACGTYAGTMNFDGSPLKICSGSDFSVSFNEDASLNPDDLLGFVLHDNTGTQLGTIYAISNDTTFTFPNGIILGQTYYVSAIAGSNDGNGNINLNDQCLSVAQGVPVIFYQPQATLIGGGEICPTECITFTFNLTGEKPFEIMYQVDANGTVTDHIIITDSSNMSLLICPEDYGLTNGTIDIIPISLTDANCTVPLSSFPGSQTIVQPATSSMISNVLCPGHSLLVNGVVYDQSNPSGTEVMQNGAGCDSTIHIVLSYYPDAVFELNETLCFGGSLTVNGTEYNETQPQGMEILPGGSINGCDSIINIQLAFDSVVTAYFSTTLCPGESLNINGHTYDELNPTGTEVFPGESALGCDSILHIELLFYQEATYSLNPVLCNNDMIIINGVIYDESHPSGIEVLPKANYNGCDSIILINLSFYLEAVSTITDTLNIGDSIIIQQTVYNQNNPQGTETIPSGSVTGCDSLIMITLFFRQPLSALIEAIPPICHGEASGEIVVEEITGGLAPYTLILDGGSSITVTDFPIILSGLPSGKHQIILIDASSAQLELDLTIPEGPELEVDAGMDLLIPYGEDANFAATASFPVSTWTWTPDDFLSCVDCPDPQILNPDQNVTYTLIAIDQNGCLASDEVGIKMVYENEIYLPTIFSPNGDGINDTWRISSSDQNAELVSLNILDRWGGILFNCADKFLNDSVVEWDGTMKGKELGAGVYVFVAVVRMSDKAIQQVKGDITLIR